MNKTQRKQLNVMCESLERVKETLTGYLDDIAGGTCQADAEFVFDFMLKSSKVVDGVNDDVASIRDEEQDKFDNMPEGLQNSDKGSDMEEGIEYLDAAADSLQVVVESLSTKPKPLVMADLSEPLEEAVSGLDEALESMVDAHG